MVHLFIWGKHIKYKLSQVADAVYKNSKYALCMSAILIVIQHLRS